MDWLLFVAASLACFRLTRLITDDKIFETLRHWVVRSAPKKAKVKVKQGITCPFCVSFYYSLLISIGLWWCHVFNWEWILFWQPAIWGASVLFNQVFVFLSDE